MQEEIHLPSAGSIPGIPGSHAPGHYLVDWIARTATPIVEAVEEAVEKIAPKKKVAAQPADAPDPAQSDTAPAE